MDIALGALLRYICLLIKTSSTGAYGVEHSCKRTHGIQSATAAIKSEQGQLQTLQMD